MPVLKKTFSSEEYNATYQVEENQHTYRLDQFLKVYFPNFSREKLKKKIAQGDIEVHERSHRLRPSTRLHFKERVSVKIKKTIHEDEFWRGEKLATEDPCPIFEDDNLYVISKPPFMATHPTGRHIFNCATVFFEAQSGKTGHSLHRLDRETSGVLLLGKNAKVSQQLTPLFEQRKVKKCYFFIAKSSQQELQTSFEAEERLGATEGGLKRVFINSFPPHSTEGKTAHTYFKILKKEGVYSVGLAFPHTGRQHQIRVHAKAHGYPLLGDKLYLGNFELFQRFKDNKASLEDHDLMEIPRQALHALALRISYKNQDKTFLAPLPGDLRSWLETNTKLDPHTLEEELKREILIYWK